MLYKGTQKIAPIISETPVLTTKNITANGTYNASSDNADGYSSVTVNVSGGSKYGLSMDSIIGDVDTNGELQAPSVDGHLVFTGVEYIGANVLQYIFYKNPKIKSVSFPDLVELKKSYAMQYAFYQCTGLTSVDLSSLTKILNTYALYYAFYQCTSLTSVDLSSLTTVNASSGMYAAFYSCTGLTSVDLSSLTSVIGSYSMQNAFYGCTGLTGTLDLSSLTEVKTNNAMQSTFSSCTGLTSVDLSSLTTVNRNNAMLSTFYSCTGLTSVDLSSLTTIGENSSSTNYGQFTQCFNNCNALTSISFPNLEKIYCTGGTTTSYGTFANNNKVQKMYFPKLDTITYGSGASSSNQNACKNVFYGCSSLTELHFAAANQSAIQASSGYSTAWGRGAGNVTIYFDL